MSSPHNDEDDTVATAPADDAAPSTTVALMSSEFVHSVLIVVQAGLLFGFMLGLIGVWLFFERKGLHTNNHIPRHEIILSVSNTNCGSYISQAACASVEHTECVWVSSANETTAGACLYTDYKTLNCSSASTPMRAAR